MKELFGHGLPKGLPRYVDLNSLSLKPCALKDEPRFPKWFRTQLGSDQLLGGVGGLAPSRWFKSGPYGRIHVITEPGGKLRIILPYNTPFVHSTGLFCRCRLYLARLRQDVSHDQTIGHRFVKGRSSMGVPMVSADLSNMTDDITAEALDFGLKSLNLSLLKGFLFKLPVLTLDGREIVPKVLLMGLKGCFELGSLLHHYLVQRAGILSYVMCGDDLFYQGDLSTYAENLEALGPKLNRSKTVCSNTVAVFCGEYYWRGNSIKPVVPRVSKYFHNGRLAGPSILFAATRDAVEALSSIYPNSSVALVMGPLIRLLRRRWKSPIFPSLPARLRGLGFKPKPKRGGLITALGKKHAKRCAYLSIGVKEEDPPEQNRWFKMPVVLTPELIEKSLVSPSLLKKGATKLMIPKVASAARKNSSNPRLHDILEWYYEGTRMKLEDF
jgi:hypothetical protein